MTQEERLRRAEESHELLTNPILADAFVSLEDQVIRQWKESSPLDSAARELAWRRYEAITALRAELKSWVDDGKWVSADQKRKSL
jgi:hypothetical protein